MARVCLSEDFMSPSLNNAAHAVEHCAVDPESLAAIDSALGRQVLIRKTRDRLALYTVTELISVPAPAVHVGTEGLARLASPTDAPRGQFDATVETNFTDDDEQPPARLTEELLGELTTGLAILAPHGGRIEPGTDLQAESVYKALALLGKPVRAWIASGFNPAGAHKCWHVTSSEISEHSFPKLGSLFASTTARGPYAHAVAFHGHNDSEAIVVGGGLPRNDEHTALKTELSSKIRIALQAVVDPAPVVEVGLSGPLAGAQRKNIVNRVTVRGNGIQIEQPAAVRDDEAQREAVARAVAEFYGDLIEEDHQ
jgi:phage replication-related protein YjqB (UPF0714/DUF867 family)